MFITVMRGSLLTVFMHPQPQYGGNKALGIDYDVVEALYSAT